MLFATVMFIGACAVAVYFFEITEVGRRIVEKVVPIIFGDNPIWF